MKTMDLPALAAFLRGSGFALELPFAVDLPASPAGSDHADVSCRLVCQRRLRLLAGRRLVCAGTWRDCRVVVKFYFDSLKARRHWRRERQGLEALRRAGLATAEILVSGRDEKGKCAFLVLAELPGAQTFCELWRAEPEGEKRRRRLAAVITTIADHHRAGLLQVDNHWGNFLFSADRVYTIDGDAIKPVSPGRELDRERSLANLALFLAEPEPGIDAYREESWRLYCARRGWHPEPGELNVLAEQVTARRFTKAEKFVRKIGRDCTAVSCRQSAARFMLVDRRRSSPFFEELLADPDRFMAVGEVLKAGNSATVVRVRQGDSDLVIKRYNIKNVRHALRRGLRPSRAWVSWRHAQLLGWWGIAVPRPLAMIEKRTLGLRSSAWLVSDYVAGHPALTRLPELPPQSPELASWMEQFATLLGRLLDLRLTHGDFKASNFLCGSDGRLYLLDLDAMRYWSKPSPRFPRAAARDHQRLLANWHEFPGLLERFEKIIGQLTV